MENLKIYVGVCYMIPKLPDKLVVNFQDDNHVNKEGEAFVGPTVGTFMKSHDFLTKIIYRKTL